jgi:hypothetical protein
VVVALTPVGAASGWGRIKVEETTGGPVTGREIDVDLFGLEPGTEHSVEIDGVHLGSVMTDSVGWATLKLESPDDGHPPVPADLPPIGDLQTVLVRDDSAAFVLEGSFVPIAGAPLGDTNEYEEKIELIDPNGVAQGVAKVEREAGEQEFKTWGTGLMPFDPYTIVVDDIMAGIVFANVAGQAQLELEAPDDSNPLPPSLQPVEGLRIVEWLDKDGVLTLSGSFTGVPNDDDEEEDGDEDGEDEFKGGITGLFEGGFMLQTASSLLTVYVDGFTTYEDVAGFDNLMVGDIVEIHGDMLSETEVQALRVELEDGDNGGDDD